MDDNEARSVTTTPIESCYIRIEHVRTIGLKTKHVIYDATWHLVLALNSRPMPRRVGCFMYPKKKISLCIAVENDEVVYGPQIYLWKVSRQSVHKLASTSTSCFLNSLTL